MAAQRTEPRPAPLQGVLLFLVTLLLGLAFWTHRAAQPACGPLADWVADRLISGIGPIATWFAWATLPPIAILWALGRGMRNLAVSILGFIPFIVVLSTAVAPIDALGGGLGRGLLDLLGSGMGPWGRWIVLVALGISTGWIAWRLAIPAAARETATEWGAARIAEARERSSRSRSREERPARKPPRPRSEKRRPGKHEDEEDSPDESEEEPRVQMALRGNPPAEPRIRTRSMAPAIAPAPIRGGEGGSWTLPDISLLSDLDGTRAAIDREEILETSKLLVKTLKDFDVQGRVGEVHPGPVVTRYEFEPAPGVRVNQIVSRIDDLALALRASRIRLVAPIPGKAAVGIEVPNRKPAMISLKEILDSDDFRRHEGVLTLGLGREISGQPVFARLDTMPHLLVAGTTGSGKSVCLNGLLLSLLFRHTPDELRLLLIDPKRLELTPYDGIPSLLCPVVTEPPRATRMLEWLCEEMDRRYRVLQQFGAKNIAGYRHRAKQGEGSDDGTPPMENLPYIVVVVDELADLMLTQGIEIESPISRLAHMARAVGIHMILATQRPSVDVLTGVIKANFPARIAFQVASRIDSRTILDAGGAEFLLGRGDMLFVPPGKAEAVRVHGAFVPETDTERVAAFLAAQPPAPVLAQVDEGGGGSGDPTCEDDLFLAAMRLVVRERQASVSFLQRRLKVGYSRAARLMDLLEAAGVVSPYDGSKARNVQVDEKFLEDWENDHPEGPPNGRRS